MELARYPHARIQSIQSLCCALSVSEAQLRAIARRAPHLYVGPRPKLKKNSTAVRYVFDTRTPLKPLLKRINSVFFRRVLFPSFLTGSLPGKDFVQNVAVHAGAKRVVTEDIKRFFDHITVDHVFRIWHRFFKFEMEVAEILTMLTTKDGAVCQGTPTSSYLPNLAFWDREPALVDRLSERGIRYSRYVDDVTISSPGEMTDEDVAWAIAQIYGMIGGNGFQAQRAKHGASTARNAIKIMGLNANSERGPTVSRRERSNVRAMVFQLEQQLNRGDVTQAFREELSRVMGKIGRLKRLHSHEASLLRARILAVSSKLKSQPVVTLTTPVVAALAKSESELPF